MTGEQFVLKGFVFGCSIYPLICFSWLISIRPTMVEEHKQLMLWAYNMGWIFPLDLILIILFV